MNTRIWIAGAAALALVACGGGEEGERVELGQEPAESGRASWPEGLDVQVDSANLEYMNGDIEAAAARYRTLTEEHPEIGTLWFGLYMAENALGNQDAAAAALVKVEELSPGLAPVHEAAENIESGSHPTMPGMPSGHPPVDSVDPADAPPLGPSEG